MKPLVSPVLACLAIMFSGAAPVRAGFLVTPVVTDARLASVTEIATDGASLFLTGGAGTAPFGRVYSVAIGGGSLNQLYGYNGSSSPAAVDPAGITVLGTNLYWLDPNSGPITDTQLFRAPKDGSGPITAIYTGASVGQPIVDGVGIATDGTKLYTADEVQGRIDSLNPDGSGITQLGSRYGGFFDREHINNIDVSDGIIYIADSGEAGFSDTPPRIQSIPTGGGSFTTLFTGSLPGFQPSGIAVGNDSIFLTNGNQILQMPKTGGTPTVLVTDPRFGRLEDLVLSGDSLYVTDLGSDTIWKVEPFATAVPEPATATLAGLGLTVLACSRLFKRR